LGLVAHHKLVHLLLNEIKWTWCWLQVLGLELFNVWTGTYDWRSNWWLVRISFFVIPPNRWASLSHTFAHNSLTSWKRINLKLLTLY